jgi:hypothetical protein
MPKERLSVVISSTVLDLPDHRPEVMNACLQQDMLPLMMEHLPANDDEAISASLKLVNEADIYLGVFAFRYGYVPKKKNPKLISITEMEYNRAVRRKIPRLVFLMDNLHPLTIGGVEIEAKAQKKLGALKKRLQERNHVKSFKSPQDLRAFAVDALSDLGKQYALRTNRTSDTNIFVANSKYDWERFAKPLVERLRDNGFKVWVGQHQKEHELNQVLELSGWLVLCVSPSALKSRVIRMQLDYFLEKRKEVALLMCRGMKPPDHIKTRVFAYSEIGDLIMLIKSLRQQSPFAKYDS